VSYVLSIAILVACLAVVIRGFVTQGGIFQYPTLLCVILLGFLGPQVVWSLVDGTLLPEGALEKTLGMTILVIACAYAGFQQGLRSVRPREYARFSTDGLVAASAIASAFGVGFLVALNFLPEDLIGASQWTGTPTAYLFFARSCTVAMSITALIYAATGNRLALTIFAIDSLVILDRVLGAGRRGDLAEWLFIAFLAMWFGRSRAPGRFNVVAAIVLALGVLNFIGPYRSAVADVPGAGLVKMFEIDWGETLSEGWSEVAEMQDWTASELRNAARDIDIIDTEGSFDFGTSLWNTLVFNYYPAQVFGMEKKESLYLDLASDRLIAAAYDPWIGSTRTGLSDSFASFWYFGALIFAAIGFVLGRLYGAARRGSLVAALLYMNLLSPALHSFTHHTHWFLASIPGLLLYLVPILLFARLVGKGAHRAVPGESHRLSGSAGPWPA
jgi:hypothetical protein